MKERTQINIRVSSEEKKRMLEAAKNLQLSLTDALLKAFWKFVEDNKEVL